MENNCKVINDLMPLCTENLASEESVALVEAHVSKCDNCRAAYEELKQNSESVSKEQQAAPLKDVKKKLRRRAGKIAALCALAVFVIMLGVFSSLTIRHYVPYSPDLISVEELEKGGVLVRIYEGTGFDTTHVCSEEEGENFVQIKVWTTGWDKLIGKNDDKELKGLISYFEVDEKIDAVDYCDCANDGELIRIYGEERDGGSVVLERLVLNYYFLLASLGAILAGILWLILRKRPAGKAKS